MRRGLELALAGLLIAAGATSFFFYARVFVDPIVSDDWNAAAAFVIERAGPQDVVRIEPFWFERGLIGLGPVGDRVQRIRDPIPEDMLGVERVFVVSDADRLPSARSALGFLDEFETHAFGSTSVLVAPIPDQGVVWELRESLEDARVSRVRGDEVETCDRWNAAKKRWDCKRPDRWKYVGAAEREMGDDPRKCVWAHPLDRGQTLRIDVDVPPAKRIRVRDSFDLRAARLGGAPVLMQVFANDELVVEDRVAGNDHDWQAHDIDVSHIAGPVALRIEIDLLGPIKNRFFCLNAWAYDSADR